MARARVNYTIPAKNFRALVFWAHGACVRWQGKHTADQKKENSLWIGRGNLDCFPRTAFTDRFKPQADQCRKSKQRKNSQRLRSRAKTDEGS
jgi:hypothetical protein